MKIFPSYAVTGDEPSVHPENSFWGSNKLCLRCGQYRLKKCAGLKDGISRCRRGLSVVREQTQVWFGLRVKGFFNRTIRLPFGFVQFELTKEEVMGLVGIELNWEFLCRIKDAFVSRDGLYVRNLNAIWRALADVMRKQKLNFLGTAPKLVETRF